MTYLLSSICSIQAAISEEWCTTRVELKRRDLCASLYRSISKYRRKMKHISIDCSGIEKCPMDIQISCGAREMKDITPPSPPPIRKFLIYGPIFMKLVIYYLQVQFGSQVIKNKLSLQPHPKILSFLFMIRCPGTPPRLLVVEK